VLYTYTQVINLHYTWTRRAFMLWSLKYLWWGWSAPPRLLRRGETAPPPPYSYATDIHRRSGAKIVAASGHLEVKNCTAFGPVGRLVAPITTKCPEAFCLLVQGYWEILHFNDIFFFVGSTNLDDLYEISTVYRYPATTTIVTIWS